MSSIISSFRLGVNISSALKSLGSNGSIYRRRFATSRGLDVKRIGEVDLDNPDEADALDEALASNNYNRIYFNLNNQGNKEKRNIDLNMETNIDDPEAIDSYEKLYQDSYSEHEKSVKKWTLLKQLQDSNQEDRQDCFHNPRAEGRIYIGDAGVQLLRRRVSEGGRDILTVAEVAASLGCRRMGDLVPGFHSAREERVEVRAILEHQVVVVTVEVFGQEGEDCRTKAFTGCFLALANIYHAVKETSSDCSVRDIKVS